MTIRVFVSYRRDDSKHAAGRLGERLNERFTLFMDVNQIGPGSDFTAALRQAVNEADVLLAVIGSQWLTITAEDGGRRIDQPDDWVALEIGTALRQGTPVIPVLVDSAHMPRRGELPVALADMANRQPIRIAHESFAPDSARLIETIEGTAKPEDLWPPVQPAPQRPKSRSKILVIIGAAALTVILIAVIAVVMATRGTPSTSPQGGLSTSGQPSHPPPTSASETTRRPSDAVASYLQALAAGDATAALSYTEDPAPQGPLLTDAVLAESRKRTPLTAIDVPAVGDKNAKSVSATYMLGSAAVNESFDVVKVANTWKLSRAVKDLDLSAIVDGPIPLQINGVKVTQASVAVLPGSYEFTTGQRYVSYGSRNVVLIKSPHAKADTGSIQSQLTQTGEKAAVSAAKKSYNMCLNAHSLNPKNCPQNFSPTYSYDESTITWRQAGSDPFQRPAVSFRGTQARIKISLNLKVSASCTNQGRSGTCTGTLTGTSVGVVKMRTTPLRVEWRE
jgi:TIR domain